MTSTPVASSIRIGVLGLQGAVAEHVDALRRSLAQAGHADAEAFAVRHRDHFAALDGLVLPGGESTTISKLLRRFDIEAPLLRRVREEDFPVMGTCAGLILLSSEGDDQVAKTGTHLLGLMDMATDRNAFGRQRESFEEKIAIKGHETPLPGVFIRAPAVTRVWGACEATGLMRHEGRDLVIAARQGNRRAYAFHPELTPDTRVHDEFVATVAAWHDGRRA